MLLYFLCTDGGDFCGGVSSILTLLYLNILVFPSSHYLVVLIGVDGLIGKSVSTFDCCPTVVLLLSYCCPTFNRTIIVYQ